MDLPAGIRRSRHEATAASSVFEVFLDHLAGKNTISDILHCNHSIRAGHLPDRVGKEQ